MKVLKFRTFDEKRAITPMGNGIYLKIAVNVDLHMLHIFAF
jgi:hypothetical protein